MNLHPQRTLSLAAGLLISWTAASAPARAEPSLEGAKAASGLRFMETSGVPAAIREAPAVSARDGGGGRPQITFSPRSSRPTAEVPTPRIPEDGGFVPPSGTKLGTRLLTVAGGIAGAAATFIIAVHGGALLWGAMGVGGAAAGISSASAQGKKGWQLAGPGVAGFLAGLRAPVTAGMAAGYAAGKLLERIF